MKKRFLIVFFMLTLIGLGSTSFAEQTPINYSFYDRSRDVEYPKYCAGCGKKLLSIEQVPGPEPKDRIFLTYPGGSGWYKETVYMGMKGTALSGKGVFTVINGALCFVAYEPTQINFYYEEADGKLADSSFYIETTKYKLLPLTVSEKSQYIIGASQKNGSYPFFVCSKCAKCDAGCGKYAASNGFSIPAEKGYEKDTSKLVVGTYCPDHTCAFIWNVNNGDFNTITVEGIDCKSEAMAGSLFCKKHTCQDPLCVKPVVGLNTTDSRSTALRLYQGPYEEQYSNYCVDHFCKHYVCKGKRVSVADSTAEFLNGKYTKFPGYCTAHGNDCTIYGCSNPVIKMHYDKTNEIAVYICEYHAERYEEMQKEDIGQLSDLEKEIPDSDLKKATCANCKKYLPQEQISTGKKFGKFIDGKWYCGICASQGFIVREEVDDFEDGGGFSHYVVPTPTPPVDPATCNHSRYPVPNTVRFKNITKEQHTQVWSCKNCNSVLREIYEHDFVNGVCVCGYSKGEVPPEPTLTPTPTSTPTPTPIYTKPLIEIANAKYAMPYGEDTMLIQLEDSNSIELTIANDKLAVLSYKWGEHVIGYSEDTVPIPSRETLLLSDGGGNISGFVMEKPSYILTVAYYTKEENARRTTIKYQIYLP